MANASNEGQAVVGLAFVLLKHKTNTAEVCPSQLLLLALLSIKLNFQHLIKQPEVLIKRVDFTTILLCILCND